MTQSYFTKIQAVIGVTLLATSTLRAGTYVVSSNSDSGSGSLRQAINSANSHHGGDIIFFKVSGTIMLNSPLPQITTSVNIIGPGTNVLAISGNNQHAIFSMHAGTTNTLSDITLANGQGTQISGPSINGCAISNSGSTTVLNCTITNCVNNGGNGQAAGAVYNTGTLCLQECLFVASGSYGNESGIVGGCVNNIDCLTMNNCVLTNCNASDAAGIFNTGTAVLNNCLLTDLMNDDDDGNGGAIASEGGSVTLTSCTITNCGGGYEGGAVWEYAGTIILTNSVIINNNAGSQGGGLLLMGNATLENCTISGNQTGEFGGGGIKCVGNTALVGCTVSGNTSEAAEGGGIYNLGCLTMTNCTISGNLCTQGFVPFGGGGILNSTNDAGGEFFSTSAILYLTDCTIVSNSVASKPGGGVQNDAGAIAYARDSIIADNSPDDISGAFDSEGYNLIENTNDWTVTGKTNSNIYGIDPKLGPLQFNGGMTMTHALLTGSPAINAGPANATPFVDQRGLPRPSGGADDIGAYEFNAAPPPVSITLAPAGNGSFHVACAGMPGFTYTILRATSLAGPWTPVTNMTAANNGSCLCVDRNAPAGNAYYRAVYQGH